MSDHTHISPASLGRWNDATVHGDLAAEEARAALSQNLVALTNFSSKSRSGTWRRWETTLAQMIETKLSWHDANCSKDGHSITFADAVLRRHETVDGLRWGLCDRRKESIAAVTAAGFDIDGGASLSATMDGLAGLGRFAILYTTHSHGKTVTHSQSREVTRSVGQGEVEALAAELGLPDVLGFELQNETDGRTTLLIRHSPIDKFRIIFPLATPFALSHLDRRQHIQQCREWSERLTGFAEEKLGVSIDPTGCDVNRLFYTPRHDPKANWELAIFAGQALSVEEMPRSSRRGRPSRHKSGRAAGMLPAGDRPELSDGFDLLRWWSDFGDRFLIVDFLESLGWEIRGGGAPDDWGEVECPNDAAHSNAGDPNDRACWAKNANGDASFTFTCQHAHCGELGRLEMLMMLEQQACLPDGIESLSELLCRDEFYLEVDGDA